MKVRTNCVSSGSGRSGLRQGLKAVLLLSRNRAKFHSHGLRCRAVLNPSSLHKYISNTRSLKETSCHTNLALLCLRVLPERISDKNMSSTVPTLEAGRKDTPFSFLNAALKFYYWLTTIKSRNQDTQGWSPYLRGESAWALPFPRLSGHRVVQRTTLAEERQISYISRLLRVMQRLKPMLSI